MSEESACCDGSARTYIDESYRLTGRENGIYIIAAASLSIEDEEDARTDLRRALPGKLARFHWNKDSSEQHKRAIEAIAGMTLVTTVFVQVGVPRKMQERFRQHGLWNLVAYLRDLCQHNLLFEARERSQDQRDSETLSSIVHSGVGGGRFQYTFSRPLDEPLLWIPDTVLGLAGLGLVTRSDDWEALLPIKPSVFEIPPPA